MDPGVISGQIILCDYAQVQGGKLYVVGASVNLVTTPIVEPPHPINLWAGVIVTVPWNAHNEAHRLNVRLEDQDSNPVPFAQQLPGAHMPEDFDGSLIAQFNVGRAPIMQQGDESLVPLAVPLSIGVPKIGPYRVVLSVDKEQIAVARFRVIHMQIAGIQQMGLATRSQRHYGQPNRARLLPPLSQAGGPGIQALFRTPWWSP